MFVLQLFQVREFYSNILWDDIENTHPLPTLEKELRKSIRLFKKVIVRRKSVEGDVTKYLLDFGKRRVIPDIVKKHGIMLEDSSNDKKRYWLNGIYVPLHLVKNFEEKRIARKTNEVKPKNVELSTVKSSSRKKGFAYLFAKADKPELYQCGRCNKVVPVRYLTIIIAFLLNVLHSSNFKFNRLSSFRTLKLNNYKISERECEKNQQKQYNSMSPHDLFF